MYNRLKNEFFLSSMLGWTDGKFCGERCGGCEMVQLGAYFAEPTVDEATRGKYPGFFLPSDVGQWTDFFEQECRSARCRLNLVTCYNLASPTMEWAVEAANCFFEAGGDLVELNVHGNYPPYLEKGLLSRMILPENRKELFRWVDALCNLDLPLIVKLNGQHERDSVLKVARDLEAFPLFGVHVNIRNPKTKRPDMDLVHEIRNQYRRFLLVSGYIRCGEDAKEVFDAGVDMAGIAEPVIEDGAFIGSLASHYKNIYSGNS